MTNRNPIRLPPLARLRVRNPNRIEPNPCINVMASVLSTSLSPPFPVELPSSDLPNPLADISPRKSMLGLCWTELIWLRRRRTSLASMHGWPETSTEAPEYNQLPSCAVCE